MNSMTHTHLLVSKQDKISISYYEDLVVQITQIISLYFGHFYIQVFSEPKKKTRVCYSRIFFIGCNSNLN